ncbi:MAG: hypothetical protein ACRCYJ_11210, partial [Plesiomonas shigelloides]
TLAQVQKTRIGHQRKWSFAKTKKSLIHGLLLVLRPIVTSCQHSLPESATITILSTVLARKPRTDRHVDA